MEMTFGEQLMTIGICAAATIATRALPFLLFRPGHALPGYVEYLGKALPAAIFAMLVVYCVKDVSFLSGAHGVPEISGIALTAALHVWKRNMMLSMAAGTLAYMGLVQFVF